MAHIKSRKHSSARSLVSPTTVATAVGLALASLSAYAAEPAAQTTAAESGLPAVNVQGQRVNEFKAEKASSPKLTQPLVDTPQTISVIKKEIIQQQGASTLAEALNNTPGVTLAMGENGNTATGDSIIMRGFDTSGSIFLDGIRDLGTISRDTFNTEQIEVVKGPSGSDNGRGSPTGYINLVSKVPTLEEAYSGTASYKTGDLARFTADLNKPLNLGIEGSAVRLNLMTQNGGVARRDHVENNRWGIAPSVALGLGTSTRTYLSLLHITQDNVPDGGIPAIGVRGYTNASPVLANARPVDRSNFYGSLSDYNDVDVDMVTARIEHDLSPGVTLRNTFRAGRSTQQYELTGINTVTAAGSPETWTISRSRQGKDQKNEIVTNQTSLVGDFNVGGLKHSVSTGVEFIYERQRNKALGLATGVTQGAANLYNPSVNNTFVHVTPTGAVTDGDTATWAVYAFDTIKLNEQWLLNGGLRVDHYKTEFATTATTGATTHLDKQDDLLTWKIGAVYKPAPNGSIYAAYATSEKPPGSDTFTLNAPPTTGTTSNINNPNLDPQKATTVEIGTKWDVLNKRLALTAATYYTKNKNDVADRDAVTGEITQHGEKVVKGIELGAVGEITPAWSVSAGYAYMKTLITEGSVNSTTQNGAGLSFSPKSTFTSWTAYKLPFGLTVAGGVRYGSNQVRSASTAAQTNLGNIPSYWVYDAMAAYEVNKNVSLQLNLYNLADKFYTASVNSGGSRYTLGAPRSAQLTANFKF